MLKTQLLLVDILKSNKENKKLLVKSLGYENLNKGYRRINKSLESDYIDEELLYKLVEVFGLEKNTIADSIAEAKLQIEEKEKAINQEIEDKERANFKPHLWRICEYKTPSSIFPVTISGPEAFKYVPLPPELLTFPIDKQLDLLEKIILEDFKKSKGVAGPFGLIIEYLFRKTYDETFKFDTNGTLIEKCKTK